MLQPYVKEEEACVIGNETGIGDKGGIFQKANAELLVDLKFINHLTFLTQPFGPILPLKIQAVQQ
jgi:hypothetical protein